MINVTILSAQLKSAGISTAGNCSSNGKVWDNNGLEIQDRTDVAAIIANHIANYATYQAAEEAAKLRQVNARANAKSIPSWSSWTETETLTWIETNIGSPLTTGRANLPATLTLATTRAAIITLIGIMDKMLVVLIALARMIIAMRNQTWPDLQDK